MKNVKKKLKKYKKKIIEQYPIILLRYLPHILPLNKKKVCFLSDSREVMCGNLGMIYDYLENTKYKRITLFKMDRRITNTFWQNVRLTYHLTTSKYILLEDMVAITSHMRVRKNQ